MIVNSVIGGTGNRKPRLQAKNVTPGNANVTVTPDADFDGLSNVYIAGDSKLTSGNVKYGVNIFGVTGTYEKQSITSYKLPVLEFYVPWSEMVPLSGNPYTYKYLSSPYITNDSKATKTEGDISGKKSWSSTTDYSYSTIERATAQDDAFYVNFKPSGTITATGSTVLPTGSYDVEISPACIAYATFGCLEGNSDRTLTEYMAWYGTYRMHVTSGTAYLTLDLPSKMASIDCWNGAYPANKSVRFCVAVKSAKGF